MEGFLHHGQHQSRKLSRAALDDYWSHLKAVIPLEHQVNAALHWQQALSHLGEIERLCQPNALPLEPLNQGAYETHTHTGESPSPGYTP